MVYGFFLNFILVLYFFVLLDILGVDDFWCVFSVLYVGYGIISGCVVLFIGECLSFRMFSNMGKYRVDIKFEKNL